MSIVISGGGRKAVIIGVTTVALAMGAVWEQVKKFRTIAPLVDLAFSGSLSHGTASSGTLVGAMAGSTFVLGGSPPAGLTIPSTGGTYSWTGAGSGTGVFTITETNPGAPGSPHVTTIHYSIGLSGGGGGTAGQPIGGLLLTLTKAA